MAAEEVRRALLGAGFTTDGVLALLGGDAFAALGRGETVPAKHILARGPDSVLADLIRLFLLAEAVPGPRAAQALPVTDSVALGLLEAGAEPDGAVRAKAHLQPYPVPGGTSYLASDFPAGRGALPADHVIGVGGASVTLATITPRRPVGRVLDLGTGCGIQAVLAAGHGDAVVATDSSERAIRLAELSAALSGVELELRIGSLFEPVAGELFDLIVANPPFVISPVARYPYREAALGGDELSRTVVQQAGQHLAPRGVALILANWLHVAGQSWQERLEGWAPAGCRMWVAQREYLQPAQYAEVWLKDSAELGSTEYPVRYAQWLAHFDGLRAQGVGFGWIVLERADPDWFVAEDLVEAQDLPSGEQVLAQLEHFSALHDADAVSLLAACPRIAEHATVQRTWRASDGEGSGSLLEIGGDWRPYTRLDPLVLDLLNRPGTVGQRIEAIAGGDDEHGDELTARALIAIRRLIAEGLMAID